MPGGWEPLVKKYYDVMYTESYAWWTLAIAFDAKKENIQEINKYAFDGCEDLGINIQTHKERVIVAIYCRLGANIYDWENQYDYDEYDDEEEDGSESNDRLLNLLVKNRTYLKKGDYRLLYGIWKIYGDDAENMVPEPDGMKKIPKPMKDLLDAFETM